MQRTLQNTLLRLPHRATYKQIRVPRDLSLYCDLIGTPNAKTVIFIANMVTVIFIQSLERIDFVEFWKSFAYQEQVHISTSLKLNFLNFLLWILVILRNNLWKLNMP